MAISIKGVNTGVIRKSNNFIALALKIKEPRNKESLFFMSAMELRDLLIALESRLHQKHKLDAAARLQYEQARDKVIKKMAENIPEILVDELKNADINRRVNTLELTDDQGENLTFVLTLHDGSKCELVVNELQIEMLARAIIHAINNAEMRELALRITSLLDFLPLYDVDCQENGNLEYDTYSQPEWKHNLFNHYLAVLYRFKDESGNEQFSGAVVKTREATPGKEVEAITRRMLDFSPRLKKLAGVPCQVYVRTVAANNAQPLTQDQCFARCITYVFNPPAKLHHRRNNHICFTTRLEVSSLWITSVRALINLTDNLAIRRDKTGQHSLRRAADAINHVTAHCSRLVAQIVCCAAHRTAFFSVLPGKPVALLTCRSTNQLALCTWLLVHNAYTLTGSTQFVAGATTRHQ